MNEAIWAMIGAVVVVNADTGRRPEALAPVYIRQADAQIGWAKRGALHGGTGPGP